MVIKEGKNTYLNVNKKILDEYFIEYSPLNITQYQNNIENRVYAELQNYRM